MSEPRYISPMLDGFSLGQAISDHSGVECYPAMRDDSEKRYIVKKISLPASQVQVEALLLTGVYRDANAVGAYYKELAQGVRDELRILEQLSGQRGFVPYQECQIEPMEEGVGYEVHLLSRYRKSLERFVRRNPMTHLGALNLGIDLCAALAVCRESGWLYVDLKPENIYLFNDQEYRIGDLGFVALDSLEYASLPDRYRSIYTAPEVTDAYSRLNATMDTYALGLILYQIYNEGSLPFTDEESRQAWVDKLRSGEPMEPPVCADQEMAEIICKACACSPEDRWQTPAEMGHAIISYMQRNGAEDIPITRPVQPEEEAPEEPAAETTDETVEESVEISAESETTVEELSEKGADSAEESERNESAESESAEPVGEPVEESAEITDTMESIEEESAESDGKVEDTDETDTSETPDTSEEPTPDWIDLADAFLAEEEPAADAAEPGEPTLRELLEDTDEMVSEADAVAAAEEVLTAEAADILTAAEELIEHEAPAPVVAPEPIDIPIPEPIAIEPEDEPEAEAESGEPAEEAPAEPGTPELPAEPKEHSGLWKKIIGAAAGVLAAAGLILGALYYYQNIYLQTIDSMTYDGTGTQVTVTVVTAMDESKLTVICKDTYGNAVEGKLTGGVVTFSDLVPGSQYIISLEPEGFHKLQGTTTFTYSTPAETAIMDLTAVTGQEPGSAIISFGVEGTDSTEWLLTWNAEGTEQSLAFTGHSVTVTGLTVGSEYTFTLTPAEEVLLVGENTITHTASDLIQAQNVALTDYSDGNITISWTAPENVSVERWIVRCYNADGYDQLQEVTEPTALFGGITEGAAYTVEVTASNMTLGVRAEVTADASAITGFTAIQNGNAIELSWNYSGEQPANGWTILWSADGGAEQALPAEGTSAVLSPAAPGSAYTFTIQAPEGSSAPNAVCTLQTAAAGAFSANKLDTESIIVKMCAVPTRSGWGYSHLKRADAQDTFQPGGSLALLYTVTKPYSSDKDEFETLFIIHDSAGGLAGISSHTRSWNEMWDNGYCTETVSNLPSAPGSYTLTICVGGGILAQIPFNIQ